MKNQKFLRVSAIRNLTLSAVLILSGVFCMAQSGQITHTPSYVEALPGEEFEVTVNIDPAGEPVSVVDIHMHFNAEMLEVISLETLQTGAGSLMIQPSFSNTAGTITMGLFSVASSISQSEFPLLKIVFRALSQSGSTVVEHPANQFPRTILAYAGEDKLLSASQVEVVIIGNETVSVNEALLNKGDEIFELWPNPARSIAFIGVHPESDQNVNIHLCDLTGRIVSLVYGGVITADDKQIIEINLNGLSDGVYLVRMSSQEGTVVKRLVVNN